MYWRKDSYGKTRLKFYPNLQHFIVFRVLSQWTSNWKIYFSWLNKSFTRNLFPTSVTTEISRGDSLLSPKHSLNHFIRRIHLILQLEVYIAVKFNVDTVLSEKKLFFHDILQKHYDAM